MGKLKRALVYLSKLPSDALLYFVTYFPGIVGEKLRYFYWRKRLRHLGKGVKIDTGVFFQNPHFIEIGDNCWIDKNVIILAGLDKSEREKVFIENRKFPGDSGVVHIGKNVHIGPFTIISGIAAGVYISDDCCITTGCRIYAFSHHYKSPSNPSKLVHFGSMGPADRQCLLVGPIFIGENTGVALGSVILPGVAIGKNSFVKINSVVYKGDYPDNSLIEGNPAKVVGKRFEKRE